MDPSPLQLFLDEFDAHMERRFAKTLALLDQQISAMDLCASNPEQYGAVSTMVADNRGDLFEKPLLDLDREHIRDIDEPAATDAPTPPKLTPSPVNGAEMGLLCPGTSDIHSTAYRTSSADPRIRPRLQFRMRPLHPGAEDDDADDPVDPGPKFASLTSFRIHGGLEAADLFQKLGLNRAEDIVIYHGCQLHDSGVTLTYFLCGSALHRFEHRVTAAAFLPRLRKETYSTARPDPAAVRRAINVRDDMLLAGSEALAEEATKENFAKAYELLLASRLPHPDDFVKDAETESCMYMTTTCSMQVHNSTSCLSLLLTLPISLASSAWTIVASFLASAKAGIAGVKFSSYIIDNQGMAAPRLLRVVSVEVIGPVKYLPVYVLVVPMVSCLTWVPSNENEFEVGIFQQQPWPLPTVLPLRPLPCLSISNYVASVKFVVLGDSVQVRPSPWPSFGCQIAWCSTCLVHTSCHLLLSKTLMEVPWPPPIWKFLTGIIKQFQLPQWLYFCQMQQYMFLTTSLMIPGSLNFKLGHIWLVEGLVYWIYCNPQYTIAGTLFLFHLNAVRSVKMLIVNWDGIWLKDHWSLPACVCGTDIMCGFHAGNLVESLTVDLAGEVMSVAGPVRFEDLQRIMSAITTVLLLLELFKLKEKWQCAVCLAPTHLGVTGHCFPDGYSIANLCCHVVLTGSVHMDSDINVQVLLIAGVLIQEQQQNNHNGCSRHANVIMSILQDSVQFYNSFTLSNCCSDISVELQPVPWPPYRAFHEATVGWWCFSLFMLPTWLPSAWWPSGYHNFPLWDPGGVVLQLVWADMLRMSRRFILVLFEEFWTPV